jgi:hypothetical protein
VKAVIILTIVVLSPLAIWAADDIKPLDAKVGLWEYAISTQMSGMPGGPATQIPEEARKSMSPEQLARLEGLMAGRGGGTQASTVKVCLTAESMNRGIAARGARDSACTYKVVSSSASKQEIHMDCPPDKDARRTADITFERVDPDHIKGTIASKTTGSNDRTVEVKTTITGKWVSSDCGNVKPVGEK